MRRPLPLFGGLIALAAVVLAVLLLSGAPVMAGETSSADAGGAASRTFAIIGDYGMNDANEGAVAALVRSWAPSYIIATGDDYYAPAGGEGTGKYDESTGAYYGPWLKDITTTGTRYPVGGAAVNSFFPAMGNHDYRDATPAPDTYLTYFDLPGAGFASTSGNERYYDFVEGPVHFFVLDSCPQEPDGTSPDSKQAFWLKGALAASTSTWNIVYDHHPPYSSDVTHGSTGYMQWPFAQWGADVVVSGHAHIYERILRDGIVYFVNGDGGAERYALGTPVAGSAFRYSDNWGAQNVTVGDTSLIFAFYTVDGVLEDSYAVNLATPAAPSALVARFLSATQVDLSWTDASHNEAGFQIERLVAGEWTQVATVGAGVTTFSDRGLTPATTYFYRLRADNAAGDSAYSDCAGATTPDG
jgi:hypothetical protein